MRFSDFDVFHFQWVYLDLTPSNFRSMCTAIEDACLGQIKAACYLHSPSLVNMNYFKMILYNINITFIGIKCTNGTE